VSSVGAAALSTFAGYGFARYVFRGRGPLLGLVLGTIMVPTTALAIPTYLLFSKAGLVNTPWAVILPSLVSPFGLFLMWVYARDAVSDSVLEAARIDGAGELAIFFRVVLRSLGPGLMSGRIADIAVHPTVPGIWYVAAGSGGVWKTTNAGTTWTPVFEDQTSYSIGEITLDPENPDVVWVGTGENVSGRHVGWGDGVYRSRDAGRTWQRMGLPRSEHIGRILVDPRDGNRVLDHHFAHRCGTVVGVVATAGGRRALSGVSALVRGLSDHVPPVADRVHRRPCGRLQDGA